MIPLLLIGAAVVGACVVLDYSSFVVGPGEQEAFIQERHHIGKHDDHREYRH
ncbi:hypothetical protein [Streptomyces sp. NBC_01451]|uniref:hypothetical protein n=1 Tax=Streptomyces sp. NBC_01451 TaxID=2903872 RepID=UPI002E2F414F|nr:hypothetical protein [Streptomyces sp. NBC_01451]